MGQYRNRFIWHGPCESRLHSASENICNFEEGFSELHDSCNVTYLASRASANTPAASGAAAEVPEWVRVHFPYKSVVACEHNKYCVSPLKTSEYYVIWIIKQRY